jgi:hypothetical protein
MYLNKRECENNKMVVRFHVLTAASMTMTVDDRRFRDACSCLTCREAGTMSLNCGHQRAYCSTPRSYMSMESHGGMILTGKTRRTLRKTCASATLSTTNPTRTDPGAKPRLRGERPATQPPEPWHGLQTCLLPLSSGLMMTAKIASKTSVSFYEIALCYMPEVSHLQ